MFSYEYWEHFVFNLFLLRIIKVFRFRRKTSSRLLCLLLGLFDSGRKDSSLFLCSIRAFWLRSKRHIVILMFDYHYYYTRQILVNDFEIIVLKNKKKNFITISVHMLWSITVKLLNCWSCHFRYLEVHKDFLTKVPIFCFYR